MDSSLGLFKPFGVDSSHYAWTYLSVMRDIIWGHSVHDIHKGVLKTQESKTSET